MSEKTPFEKLAAIDVSKHIEKKSNLSYLSWSWALDQLMRQDPTANWVMHEPVTFADTSMMVSCTVTAFNKPIYMWLPVMDHKNKAIETPNAVDINKAMMRCLVKAIACHGLGLYIYSGEDLPERVISEEGVSIAVAARREASARGMEAYKAVVQKEPKEITDRIPAEVKAECTKAAKDADAKADLAAANKKEAA